MNKSIGQNVSRQLDVFILIPIYKRSDMNYSTGHNVSRQLDSTKRPLANLFGHHVEQERVNRAPLPPFDPDKVPDR